MKANSGLLKAVAVCLILTASACGGGGGEENPPPSNNTSANPTPSFKVGGTMVGLPPNTVSVLRLKRGASDPGTDLSVNANGPFTFPPTVPTGQSFQVLEQAPPEGRPCAIRNGTGVMGNADVTNVSVGCLTIGGGTSGLDGVLHLQLSVDGGAPNTLRVDDDAACTFDPVTNTGTCPFGTTFGFRAGLLPGQAYAATVASNPVSQSCTVSNGSGTIGSTRVTNIGVSCTNTGSIPAYRSLGGTASGPVGRLFLQLAVNGQGLSEDFVVQTSGAFTFPHRLSTGDTYAITIRELQGSSTCSVLNGSGTVGAGSITNVSITCTAS